MKLTADQIVVILLVEQVPLPRAKSETDSAIQLTSMEALDFGAHSWVTYRADSQYFNDQVCRALHNMLKLLPDGWMSLPLDPEELPPQGIKLSLAVEYVVDDQVGPAIFAKFVGGGGAISYLTFPRPSESDTRSAELYEFFAKHLEIAGKLPASAYS